MNISKLRFFVFFVYACFVCLSPSIRIIPKGLFLSSIHDNQRLVELLLIFLVIVVTFFSYVSASGNSPNNKICNYILYALIILSIASSLLAESPRHALIEVSLYIGLYYLAIFISDSYKVNPEHFLKKLIYLFIASILLCMTYFYVGYITATIFNTPLKWPAPLTNFNNIRFFNQYQLWTLGVVTLPLLNWQYLNNRLVQILLNLSLIGWAIILFYSTSRGALIAIIIGLMITAIFYKRLALPFIKIHLVHLMLGFLGYLILFRYIPLLKNTVLVTGEVLRSTTYDRIDLWSLAWSLTKENPFLGVGPMHFAWYSKISAHPHNSFLQLVSEWGIPTTIILLGIVGYAINQWFKKANSESLRGKTTSQQNLAVVLFFTMVTGACYSLVDGVIVMPVSQIMMFTIIGVMIGFNNKNTQRAQILLNPIFSIGVFIILLLSITPEVIQGITGSEKRFSIGYQAIGPRFWLEIKP